MRTQAMVLHLMVLGPLGVLPAQTIPTRTLVTPEAKLDHEWTRVASIRELSDGRLIVLDPHDKVLMWVDVRLFDHHPDRSRGAGSGGVGEPDRTLGPGRGFDRGVRNSQRGLKVISPNGRLGDLYSPQDGRPCGGGAGSDYQVSIPSMVDATGSLLLAGHSVPTWGEWPNGTDRVDADRTLASWLRS